jgi:hypothetical protein
VLYDAYRDAVREALACFDVSQEMTEIVFAALDGRVFHQVTGPHQGECRRPAPAPRGPSRAGVTGGDRQYIE